MKLNEFKIGDFLICVKDFIQRNRPDFLEGKKYVVISKTGSGKYCTVTFRNENGIRHSLTTEYLKEYFDVYSTDPSAYAQPITETQT